VAVFEDLRARLDRLLRDHSRPDPRARAAALRDALVEAKVGVQAMLSALTSTEQELASERRQLADAERRRQLAAELPDRETVAVAERFAQRHRDRVGILERKLAVQREELGLARREVAEILAEYRSARQGPTADSIDAAWRDLAAAGADRPGLEPDDAAARKDSDEKLKQAVEEQLAYLKKKLGKDSKP
jgi:hypothetical protein